MELLKKYKNGNADIEIFSDGTRVVQYPDILELDYPLNIDIRVTNACPYGYNPKTGKSVCEFCHESARVDGEECDYIELIKKLEGLPEGIEIAVGGNEITQGLIDFLFWCYQNGIICNLTINERLLKQNTEPIIRMLLDATIIRGLGISYRKNSNTIINEFYIDHPNVVLHTIAGIDEVDDIINLPFQKILVLGYKKFGFGVDYYSPKVEKNIKSWYWWIKKLIDAKKVVSFDNLALEQLNIRRFFTTDKWEEFNQGEHSMYINAVDGYFAPSSRSDEKTNWDNITIKDYFKQIEKYEMCY